MKINTTSIYNNYINFSYLIKEYEQNSINTYKSLIDVSTFWNDGRTEKFLEHVKKEKLDADTLCNELYKVRDVYSYIYEEYSKYGNRIAYKPEAALQLLQKFEDLISEYNLMLNKYSEIDYNFENNETNLLKNERDQLKDCLEKIESIKSYINEFVDTSSKIEQNIKTKISKIDI